MSHGVGDAVQEALRVGHRRWCAELARHELAQRHGRVAVQLGVGGTPLLEVKDVEERVTEDAAERLRRRNPRPRHRRKADPDDAGHPVRVQQRSTPGHHAAEVVADEHGPLGVRVIEQPDDVTRQLRHRVRVDGVGPRRTAVATLIGCQHVIAGLGQDRELVAPGVGQFGEAVQQHDHGVARLAGFEHAQRDPVGVDESGAHGLSQARA